MNPEDYEDLALICRALRAVFGDKLLVIPHPDHPECQTQRINVVEKLEAILDVVEVDNGDQTEA